ncbi:MAG: HlyD family efflux transporter periplasmic adaptor subunit [Candidatus Rokubacteria bacterium]|nr:HlyD family efflux transporter periplasmic adaptor subunit [Candidatus Rokubacteria bacterium]
MTAAEPKLRSDLVISRQDGAVVVKDPATGRFFRFGEAEHFITSQLDGATPLDVVRRRAGETFGSMPEPEMVEGFVATLRRLGLIETDEAALDRPGARRRRTRGSPLYLRLRAFDPDPLLDRMVGKVGFCFTPAFLVLSAAVIALGLGIAVAEWGAIARDLERLWRVEMVLVAWLIIFAVTTAHEFAHSLTCKRFGGHVHEMGFLLIYFQLAFYCNVSDAWLFPEKSRRLWVTSAGPYFEMFLWALAVITWRVTEPGTGPSAVALVVVATSAFKLFINLNPLIKLDGYYLLSDALGIPNLRAHAFGYLKRRLSALVASSGRTLEEPTPRERRVYLAYGLLAGGYSVWLLGWVAWAVGGFLTERYQGAGAILYAGLLGVTFQNPLRRWAVKPALVRAGREQLTRYLSSGRRPARVLLPLSLVVAALFLVPWQLTVSGDFSVAPRHNADVRAEVDGIIAEVYVDEGQRVDAGALIARLADRDYRAELRAVEAQIDETGARLKLLRAGPRAEELRLARQNIETAETRREYARRRYEEAEQMQAARVARATADVAKAEERLRYARNDLGRFQALFRAELISRRTFEEAQELTGVRDKELAAARAELATASAGDLASTGDLAGFRMGMAVAQKEAEEARGRLRLLEAGSRPEEIEGAEAALTRLVRQRSHLEDQLRLVTVRSAVAGVVTTPKPREKAGQYVKKGDLIVEVHELETVRAEISIPEREIGDVKVGQSVVLKARAYPDRAVLGRVTAIAPAAVKEEEGWRGRVFRVTTTLENPDFLLRPEMTGTAKIYCGERRLVDVLTRRLARYLRVEFWSWW